MGFSCLVAQEKCSSHKLQGPGAELSATATMRRARQDVSDCRQRNSPGERRLEAQPRSKAQSQGLNESGLEASNWGQGIKSE